MASVSVLRPVNQLPPLSAVERTALELCRERADLELPITQADIAAAIGSQNFSGGTAPGVLNRLEGKGYITRTFFQRGVQVCIPETGQCTAPPSCTAAHWRNRKEKVQSPPPRAVRVQNPSAAVIIEREARAANIPIQEFLMDLVFNGLHMWLDRQGAEA